MEVKNAMADHISDTQSLPGYEKLSAQIREEYLRNTYQQLEDMADVASYREIEKRFLDYIALGNAELADEFLGRMRGDIYRFKIGEMSKSPLQQARYAIVASVTLFCRTAIDNGLPENLAFRISDSYLRSLDDIEDINAINYLFFSAFREYCQVMQDWPLQQCLPEVKKCCKHILQHIHEKISLQDLAEVCGLYPNHISDLFLRQTGFRPIEYIRTQKLNYARYILDSYSPPISLLANLLAFPSPSAFAQQFKEQYGVTPEQYLRRKQ